MSGETKAEDVRPGAEQELQAVLAADADGSRTNALLQQLTEMSKRLERDARLGITPEARDQATRLVQACRSAMQIVESTALKFSRQQ